MRRVLLFFSCFLLVACNIPAKATAVATRWTDTPAPAVVVQETIPAVFSHLYEASDRENRNSITGSFAKFILESTPVLYGISRQSDGSVAGATMLPWESHEVSEMQVCFALDAPCQLTDEWLPFELSPGAGLFGSASIQKFEIQVDWMGPRTLWVTRQFRDDKGNPVPSFGDTYEYPEVITQTAIEIIGVWDETMPIETQPPEVQTAVALTKSAYPLSGSVLIGGGGCCVGGFAGETLEVQVDFSATSPLGAVTEMRVRTGGVCFPESELVAANWEPLVSPKPYPVYVALNWTGFYVSVQYRDAQGNLPPVYCDDISVEGFPPASISTP